MTLTRLTNDDVKEVVSSVLAQVAEDAGFRGAEVTSDFDRDGEPILRIRARYERRPLGRPDPLISAIHAVRTALTERGEERSIILVNEVAGEQQSGDVSADEDAE